MKKLTLLLLVCVVKINLIFSQVVKIETLSTGLLYPVCIQNTGVPGDNRLFVLEKRGRIKIVNRLTGVVNPVPFLDIYNKVYAVSSANDERGLLGLAFHPDYQNNGYFYVNYYNTQGKTIIARYQVSSFADTAQVNSEQIIFTIRQPFSNHNGGNLMFGPDDGYLYIALGDGGNGGDPGNRAQNRDSLLGKTLRVDINNPSPPYYFSAPGNPFYGATPGRDEIFDWGLRNHWRCSFDRMTHDMWSADVGQSVQEEINFRSRCDTVGHNYGWRCYEGTVGYNTAGCQAQSTYEAPVFVYTHSLGCSVTGGYVYRGAQEGSLFGKYLFTDFCQGRIWATEPNGSGGWNTSQLVQSTSQINNNYSSFGEDIDGELYLAGVSSGRIYTLRDTACAPTAFIDAPDTLFVCSNNPINLKSIYGSGLTYSWTLTGAGTWTINSGQGTNSVTLSPDLNSNANIMVSVSNGTCSSVSKVIRIISVVTLSSPVDFFCSNLDPPVAFTGSPSGGTYVGPGMTGNIFSPGVAGVGTHSITYFLADTLSTCYYEASGCIFSSSKTVTAAICGAIGEFTGLKSVKVYPNPARSVLHVECISAQETEMQVLLTDPAGRVLRSINVSAQAGKQMEVISLEGIHPGIYFLMLQSANGQFVQKIYVEE